MENFDELEILRWRLAGTNKTIICKTDGCNNAAGMNQQYCNKCRRHVRTNLFKQNYNPIVYFILGVGTEMIKIGITTDINTRFTAMQVGSPVKLLILATIPGYKEDEEALHIYLKEDRAHGEWFKMSERVIDVIEAAQNYGREGVKTKLLGPQMTVGW